MWRSARVVCHYTASLNVAQAHLALQGRAFVDNPKGPLEPRGEQRPGQPMFAPLEGNTGSVLAVLAADGRWVCESRRQSHGSTSSLGTSRGRSTANMHAQ